MYIVSGVPRSGTSVTSRMMSKALGDDRMIYKRKKPQQQERQGKGPLKEVRSYMEEKRKKETKGREEHKAKMNPTGFFEMEWVTRGIRYSIDRHAEILTARERPLKGVKVVSQGLAQTDPTYVSKVLYCVRHPKNVATSQEALLGQLGEENPEVDGRELRKHSPEMYIRATVQAAKWFLINPGVPVLIVEYDRIHSETGALLNEIEDFIGEGDWSKGAEEVKPSLNRSKKKDVSHPLFPLADRIYQYSRSKSWGKIVEAVEDHHKKEIEKTEESPETIELIPCPRLGRRVSSNECLLCRTEENTRANFIRSARGDYFHEPCMRDVLEGKATIEDSIRENTWAKARGLGDTVASMIDKTGLKKVHEMITGKKNCPECNERKKSLNEFFPYK